MSPLEAVVLGVVEGVTEFLPVSSTGHLIVAAELLGARDPGGTFEVVVQLGAVLAVVWFYRRDLAARLRATPSSLEARRFWLNLLLAFLPAGLLGLAVGEWVTARLFSPVVVAAGLIAGGAALWLVERAPGRARAAPLEPPASRGLDGVTARQALLVGLAQVLALVPGVSRSGASIVGGLLAGLDRETAAAFSFYLALPTLGGATLYKLARDVGSLAARGAGLELALGTAAAFVTALLAIGWLLRYVSRHDFRGFAVYRLLAGLAVLAWMALR